jgi:EAL domain-containing protein (putative c-di-GMP-specific phosphodiesterase class I)
MEASASDMTEPKDESQTQFIEEMDRELMVWPEPVERLKSSIANDELELYCQTMLRLAPPGGYPIGEILVRLREEEKAMLPPGDFLPVFEHYAMMPELDRWVVRNALRHLAKSSKLSRLSVNVSAQTMADRKFPAYVASELAATGVTPSALVFEIDETDMISKLDVVEPFARDARRVGCGLLFDGFGKRSVSFAPLSMLRFTHVKVDGVIVRNVLKNKAASGKLNAVVKVGNAVGIEVIAECVEDPETVSHIRALGAHYAQGFGISLPSALAGL